MIKKADSKTAVAALAAFLAASTALVAASFTGGAGDGCDRNGMSSYVDLGPVNVWKFRYYGGSGDGQDSSTMAVYRRLPVQGTVILIR
jgi:hypothetical protein